MRLLLSSRGMDIAPYCLDCVNLIETDIHALHDYVEVAQLWKLFLPHIYWHQLRDWETAQSWLDWNSTQRWDSNFEGIDLLLDLAIAER